MFGAVHQGHIGIPSEMEVAPRYTLLTPGMDGAAIFSTGAKKRVQKQKIGETDFPMAFL